MTAAAVRSVAPARPRVCIGRIWIDPLSFEEALARVEELVAAGEGGAVFTPNVDHVVSAEDDPAFREAYAAASLVLADGQPILWAGRLLGTPFPEKISGSDFTWPLMALAARRGWRVYLLGGAPGVADAAAARFASELGVRVVGVDPAQVAIGGGPGDEPIARRIAGAAPDLVLVALGSPKQERWIHRNAARLGPAVALGIGASLDFVAGRSRRAPRWMSRCGLEWLHRLAGDPRRLARRYLVKDPRFLLVVLRMMRARRRQLTGGGPGRAADAVIAADRPAAERRGPYEVP